MYHTLCMYSRIYTLCTPIRPSSHRPHTHTHPQHRPAKDQSIDRPHRRVDRPNRPDSQSIGLSTQLPPKPYHTNPIAAALTAHVSSSSDTAPAHTMIAKAATNSAARSRPNPTNAVPFRRPVCPAVRTCGCLGSNWQGLWSNAQREEANEAANRHRGLGWLVSVAA